MRETVLLVDSSGTRRALTGLLLSAGFDVRPVVDNMTLAALNGSALPSVILLGLDHDEIATLSTFVRLRDIAPDTVMIILSTNTNVRVKARLLEMGADDYIQEPFEPLELLARVRSLVRRHKLRVT